MVTSICFGTSGLGDMPDTYGYGVDEARARATLQAIFDGPINFIDTSRIYGMGRSEERIGAAIRERGGLPSGFVVSTKLDRDFETNAFDAAQARRSLERSLKALGLERIDLLNLHDPEHARSLDEATARDGALGELFRIKEEGLAKAVGLAAGQVTMMMPLLRDWDFDALITHNRFTLANRNAEEMLDLAHSRGVAVLNAAPYASGVLAKGTSAYPRYVYQEASDADARSDPPHRGDLQASRRAARGRGAAVFHARPAGHGDDLRRDQARARQADRRLGAFSDFPRGVGGIESRALFDRRPRGDARLQAGVTRPLRPARGEGPEGPDEGSRRAAAPSRNRKNRQFLSKNRNPCYLCPVARKTVLGRRPPKKRRAERNFLFGFARNPLKSPIRTNKTKQIQAFLLGFFWSGLVWLG